MKCPYCKQTINESTAVIISTPSKPNQQVCRECAEKITALQSEEGKAEKEKIKLNVFTYIYVYFGAVTLYVILNAVIMYFFNSKLGWLFDLLFFIWAPRKLINYLKEKKAAKTAYKKVFRPTKEKSVSNESPSIKSSSDPILFCRKCGSRLPEAGTFCNKCGTKTIEVEI